MALIKTVGIELICTDADVQMLWGGKKIASCSTHFFHSSEGAKTPLMNKTKEASEPRPALQRSSALLDWVFVSPRDEGSVLLLLPPLCSSELLFFCSSALTI